MKYKRINQFHSKQFIRELNFLLVSLAIFRFQARFCVLYSLWFGWWSEYRAKWLLSFDIFKWNRIFSLEWYIPIIIEIVSPISKYGIVKSMETKFAIEKTDLNRIWIRIMSSNTTLAMPIAIEQKKTTQQANYFYPYSDNALQCIFNCLLTQNWLSVSWSIPFNCICISICACTMYIDTLLYFPAFLILWPLNFTKSQHSTIVPTFVLSILSFLLFVRSVFFSFVFLFFRNCCHSIIYILEITWIENCIDIVLYCHIVWYHIVSVYNPLIVCRFFLHVTFLIILFACVFLFVRVFLTNIF